MNRAVNNEVNINNGKSVAALFAEMKQELQDFVQTRVTMFKVELQEKLRVMKAAAPLAVIGATLLLTAISALHLGAGRRSYSPSCPITPTAGASPLPPSERSG